MRELRGALRIVPDAIRTRSRGGATTLKKQTRTSGPHSRGAPFRVRLPGFISGEEVGLGDAIKRLTYRAGVRPCAGCERRAATLNRWMVFSRR